MSDHEINVLVGGIEGFANKIAAQNGLRDYCNKPSDAWPIITSNRIALSPLFGGEWRASVDDECGFISYTCSTENPLRAAMTVFLMAQESANVPANSTGSDIR
ncbi:phage protein NinX family protein [Citrobacter portucalensis]|nr:phage protein NinX family protein [Citrobacter portucalensis]